MNKMIVCNNERFFLQRTSPPTCTTVCTRLLRSYTIKISIVSLFHRRRHHNSIIIIMEFIGKINKNTPRVHTASKCIHTICIKLYEEKIHWSPYLYLDTYSFLENKSSRHSICLNLIISLEGRAVCIRTCFYLW